MMHRSIHRRGIAVDSISPDSLSFGDSSRDGMTLDGRNRWGKKLRVCSSLDLVRLTTRGLARILGSFRSVSQGAVPTVRANRSPRIRWLLGLRGVGGFPWVNPGVRRLPIK